MISRWLIVPPKSRHKSKRDPQQHKVYGLERELIGLALHTTCHREHLRTVLAHACRKYKVPAPKLVFVRENNKIFGSSNNGVITLNAAFHGCNLFTLLHELAHHLTDFKYEGAEDHGVEFVRIYMDLLNRYRVLPRDAFKVMAQRRGVKFE